MKYNDYRSYSTFRTGHHAVNGWIMEHHDGDIDYVTRTAQDIPMSEVLVCWRRAVRRGCSVFVDFENAVLPDGIFKNKIDNVSRIVNIMTLRDPLNTLASIIRSNWYGEELFDKFIYDFMYHAKEFLRETTFLCEPFIAINYNRWFSDQAYRIQLGEKLGLCDTCHEPYGIVPRYGGGSSFDGRRHNGRGYNMDVLSRYKQYLKHPRFISTVNNQDIQAISLKVFGMNIQKILAEAK